MTQYQIISLIISILSLCGFGTIMSIFWKNRHEQKVANSKEQKEKKIKENFDLIKSAVKEEVDPIKHDLKILKNGTQASLRNDILTCFYRCEKKGYKTHEDADNFRDMYEAYHDLGGNSFIDKDIVPAFNRLPLKTVVAEKKQ